MPVIWSDEYQQDYEVYAQGEIDMGGFVNLKNNHEKYIFSAINLVCCRIYNSLGGYVSSL